MTEPIALMGAPGSPYTRKMLAVLRYRRIPYRFLTSAQASAEGMPNPRVALLPTFYLPGADGALEAVTDSTPLIRRFEREVRGRSLVPPDPALAVLDELIEDYGDEWLTKAMFHYRWAHDADAGQAARILPLWRQYSITDEALVERAEAIGERQISRLYVVGSNETTGPVIEASYRRFLEAFEALLSHRPFVLGARPATADFGLFGQLTQLASFDPTPTRLTLETAPRVYAWTSLAEDLSGFEPPEGGWISLANPQETLSVLLAEIGRTYVPVMLANARAVASGASEVACEVDGLPWRQPPFPYQVKCVRWLRESRAALSEGDKSRLDLVLAGTGCETLFS
ncbi:MAG TPA: glutathione S-transferase N-terminal domain-containing protein [Caulobacteraceae bacterium]|jgi:glutathione S-transferase|nr:glutathione S-transferase N-terminal domain-containing protein [Caulobacteraceae bacterium]